jgi:hypothetical protein
MELDPFLHCEENQPTHGQARGAQKLIRQYCRHHCFCFSTYLCRMQVISKLTRTCAKLRQPKGEEEEEREEVAWLVWRRQCYPRYRRQPILSHFPSPPLKPLLLPPLKVTRARGTNPPLLIRTRASSLSSLFPGVIPALPASMVAASTRRAFNPLKLSPLPPSRGTQRSDAFLSSFDRQPLNRPVVVHLVE